MKAETAEKRCWKCNRIIVGESKMGLCSKCFNTVGSISTWGLLVGTAIWKNKGKIANGAINVIKYIKP